MTTMFMQLSENGGSSFRKLNPVDTSDKQSCWIWSCNIDKEETEMLSSSLMSSLMMCLW